MISHVLSLSRPNSALLWAPFAASRPCLINGDVTCTGGLGGLAGGSLDLSFEGSMGGTEVADDPTLTFSVEPAGCWLACLGGGKKLGFLGGNAGGTTTLEGFAGRAGCTAIDCGIEFARATKGFWMEGAGELEARLWTVA
jgi:hypothetical protein